jgi:hypothetical protein
MRAGRRGRGSALGDDASDGEGAGAGGGGGGAGGSGQLGFASFRRIKKDAFTEEQVPVPASLPCRLHICMLSVACIFACLAAYCPAIVC